MDKHPPQIFHDKEDPKKDFVVFPSDLFAAVNTLFNGNESKLLLALLGCKGDGSFSPSTAYMLKMTGITRPNHYFATRKRLEDKKYIESDDQGNLYINTKKIIDEYNST